MEEKQEFGFATVGVGSQDERQIPISDFVRTYWSDGRTASISGLDDGSFTLAIHNAPESGRNPCAAIWLSRESFLCMAATIPIYFAAKGIDIEDELEKLIDGKCVNYDFSNNLKEI